MCAVISMCLPPGLHIQAAYTYGCMRIREHGAVVCVVMVYYCAFLCECYAVFLGLGTSVSMPVSVFWGYGAMHQDMCYH